MKRVLKVEIHLKYRGPSSLHAKDGPSCHPGATFGLDVGWFG